MPPVSSFVIALVIAGLTLAVGAIGLRRMPGPLRVIVGLAGIGVAVWGITLRDAAPAGSRQVRASSDAPVAPVPAVQATITGGVKLVDGAPLKGQPVVLHRFERTTETGSVTATTASDGSFAFPAQAAAASVGYRVTTIYAGTEFGSDLLLPAFHEVAPVDLTVAPSTTDAAAISLAVDSMTVVGDAAGVQALHVLSVDNAAATAYIGGLRLPVLSGAAGFEPRTGLDRTRLEIADGEVISGAPVLPGRSEIVYLYTAPVPPAGLREDRTTVYPTKRLSVLTAGVAATGLAPQSDVIIEGKSYKRWSRAGVPARTRIEATFGAAKSSASTVAVVAAAIVALGVLAFGVVRRRR